MSAAPISRISRIHGDPLTATSVDVLQDDGARFDVPPWTGLISTVQEVPVLGVNAEEVEVTDVDGDTLAFIRGLEPVELTANMQFAQLRTCPLYDLGETADLEQAEWGTAPYSIHLASPQGTVTEADAGSATAAYSFAPDEQGIWHYRFEDSHGDSGGERRFFVRFTAE